MSRRPPSRVRAETPLRRDRRSEILRGEAPDWLSARGALALARLDRDRPRDHGLRTAQYAGFRRTQRVLTTVWGSVLLVEAVLRGVLAFVLPVGTMVVVNNVVPLVVMALLVTFTVICARRSQAKGARAAAAAA